jgi:hypothetical protein
MTKEETSSTNRKDREAGVSLFLSDTAALAAAHRSDASSSVIP